MHLSSWKTVLAASALAAAAHAQSKSVLAEQMNALNQRAMAATNAGNHALASQLKSQMLGISAQLGGDLPSSSNAIQSAVVTPVGGVQNAVAPANCYGSPLTTYAAVAGTTGAIPDLSTNVFTATVSGVANPIWDIDLYMAITHTYAADLDITLSSPLGTACDVTSDNGGGNDDVFNGTLFDDQSANGVTSYVYTNGVAAPDLRPEQSINGAFRGEGANGTWTLQIVDDAGVDIGNLSSWTLTITDGTINPPPAPPTGFNPTLTFTDSPNMPILDLTVNTDTMTVSGCTGNLYEVELYTEITHTWNSDLEIRLVSPTGTDVMISDNRGGANDDVFNGTLFDQDSLNPIASYAFTNAVAAPDLQPDGNLKNYWPCPEDPNGTWTLIVADQVGADVGNLTRWDLKITTGQSGCVSNVTTYCTPSTTTNGCNPTMSASAPIASIGAGAGSFILSTANVEGGKTGLLFYGITGQNNLVWGAGSTSFLCVKAPTQRMRTQNSGGIAGGCGGTLSEDFFDYILNFNPAALGNPPAAGATYNAQAWFRDPPAVKTTNLSDGIQFSLCP